MATDERQQSESQLEEKPSPSPQMETQSQPMPMMVGQPGMGMAPQRRAYHRDKVRIVAIMDMVLSIISTIIMIAYSFYEDNRPGISRSVFALKKSVIVAIILILLVIGNSAQVIFSWCLFSATNVMAPPTDAFQKARWWSNVNIFIILFTGVNLVILSLIGSSLFKDGDDVTVVLMWLLIIANSLVFVIRIIFTCMVNKYMNELSAIRDAVVGNGMGAPGPGLMDGTQQEATTTGHQQQGQEQLYQQQLNQT